MKTTVEPVNVPLKRAARAALVREARYPIIVPAPEPGVERPDSLIQTLRWACRWNKLRMTLFAELRHRTWRRWMTYVGWRFDPKPQAWIWQP